MDLLLNCYIDTDAKVIYIKKATIKTLNLGGHVLFPTPRLQELGGRQGIRPNNNKLEGKR